MPKHLPLRPQLYAEKVEALIARAVLEGGSLDVHGEAERIAVSCGMSPASARMDFQKTAHSIGRKVRLIARAKMRIPDFG
ncbi:hypothetical protein ACMDCR_02035 [Labrys okinawensis]|uniref:hypothetical protein n=1 Tax=Labrys okinawensis TaxID=346911 RepID=UPI0039BCF539